MGAISNRQILVDQLYEETEDIFHRPSSIAAWAFLVTEVAEIGDVLLRQGHFGVFARNHEKPSSREALVNELGDAFLMLCALATSLDVNLDAALLGRVCALRERFGQEAE